jgi:hypothetical protein
MRFLQAATVVRAMLFAPVSFVSTLPSTSDWDAEAAGSGPDEHSADWGSRAGASDVTAAVRAVARGIEEEIKTERAAWCRTCLSWRVDGRAPRVQFWWSNRLGEVVSAPQIFHIRVINVSDYLSFILLPALLFLCFLFTSSSK